MSSKHPKIRAIISGGGTGGHIFPAIAIANALTRMNPENEILFVGARGRMEMEKVPAAGYRIEGLDITGFQRKMSLKNLLLPWRVLRSLWKSRRVIRKFSPDVIIGVGGYASGPLLYVGTAMKIPALIQEQNSYAGVTNRMLAKRVQRICVAYEGMERFFPAGKILLTGNPVREDISKKIDRSDAKNHFHLRPDWKTVLVVGGSLGARTLNESIAAGMDELEKHKIQVIWQTGKSYYETASELTKNRTNVHAHDFISAMNKAFTAADLIVSRSGASTVSELAVAGCPAIFVPSPNVAEDHQTANAMALVNKNAGLLVRDAEAREKLITRIIETTADTALLHRLSENIKRLAITDAADRIAEEAYRLRPHMAHGHSFKMLVYA